MEQNSIDKLNAIFRKVFEDNALQISATMTADDVDKWTSLTHLSLISEVEDAFSIKFKLKELIAMKNVGDLMKLIENKTAA